MARLKFREFVLDFFEYETPKIVSITNLKVGIINRLVQLILVSYIIGYAIIYEKGYQEFGSIESSVTTKVKGVVYTNFSKEDFNDIVPNIDVYRKIWDTADYVVPSSENNAFFVVTNVVITSNQTQSECPEDPTVPGIQCNSDADCLPGSPFILGNGVLTGKCVSSDINHTINVCEISGWCPVERDVNPLKYNKALLAATKKFTVLIKNFVDFPTFEIRRKNIPDFKDPGYLRKCTYHPVNDPLCPIFVLGDIVSGDYDKIAVKGAAVAVIIDWDCDFDYKASNCYPTYSFRRLDEKSLISPGLNFRYAQYYSDSERTLYKVYGIKFLIMAQGRGGKFSIVPLLINIGSGLGLLAVSSVLCDIVVIYFLKKRNVYKTAIVQNVTDDSVNENSTAVEKNDIELHVNQENISSP